jgi:hypothetical protein
MNTRVPDPLLDTLGTDSRLRADRLHYATGELLGADDFSIEQTYHRRQLARALLLLHGSGTVAGLRVDATPQFNKDDLTQLDEVILAVNPGLAIDRAGRLIELARPQCLRLKRWFDYLAAAEPDLTPENEDDRTDLAAAFHPQAATGAGVIIADVFLSFHECGRAPSPAFATGPFDALDASQPSRTRDAHELKLVLRKESDGALQEPPNTPVAFDPWRQALSDAAGDPANDNVVKQLRVASLAAWNALGVAEKTSESPVHEYPALFDPTALLLARVRLPASRASVTGPPVGEFTAAAWTNPAAQINNFVRNFVIPPAAALRGGLLLNL